MNEGELRFLPDGAVLREVRADVRRLAASLGAEEAVCDNLALVVDELVNNAIEHGAAYRQQRIELRVRLACDAVRFLIEFHDPEMPDDQVAELAAALAAAGDGMPSLENERGRGLFLLTVYLEGLRAERASGGGLLLRGEIER